ncbi:hypothetical protein KY309_02665 [Candidatus Woesearchaeota archaeon]|nr:hypothetical protein [Candidatus Woesearchaeota archaeon]MBW3016488.1 hypothetical protein [Candidatus Woesearchaeota archaeon]
MDKEAYDKLKKEHGILPDFNAINREFELEFIEPQCFPLRLIKRKIAERLEPVLEILEHVVNPDPNNFVDMCECRCFTNGEKKQILDIFRHMMEEYRSLLETDLLCDDEKDAQLIRKIYDLWVQEKKLVLPIIKKLKGCWQKHVEPKEVLEYLG